MTSGIISGAIGVRGEERSRCVDAAGVLDLARNVLACEADAIVSLAARIDHDFVAAVELLLRCRGRVVVSGIGKSGHIGRKISATMASTGTPAFFVHPAEAAHGDLGMITPDDVLLAISYSGESAELLLILPLVKRYGAKLVAMTGNARSTLARLADVHLDASVSSEADPLGLAPSASTAAALALGDALAFALLKARGFNAEDFARSHPSGALGRRLLTRVADVMRTGDALPVVGEAVLLANVLLEMSAKGMGMAAIVDGEGRLIGIYTDGDLRRSLEKRVDVHATRISDVMVRSPKVIGADLLAVEALRYMELHRVTGLLVTDPDGRLVGAFNTHDLLRAGIA